MLNTSNARIREVLVLICLAVIFILSLVIMGTVGVNGHITFENLNDGCLLYMSIDDNKVVSYNNGKQSESDSEELHREGKRRLAKNRRCHYYPACLGRVLTALHSNLFLRLYVYPPVV